MKTQVVFTSQEWDCFISTIAVRLANRIQELKSVPKTHHIGHKIVREVIAEALKEQEEYANRTTE